ncbi:4-hydroxybenzoate 3-monooxygenase [Streptomyces broussonetiae]|uniref:4-hydroxybenzoate 3-monooxygenase n=1 Tax=Streptomyces broussonetiae TaxID=2686304 RepID=A0A6I6NQ29_9ACTN|nr:4-hydroxybenzoate 3-monooxygenase [Streptomyces broussonetiae]QHA10047.1 4-hydroxybenzoate 3-monooxygenase [Streptomyces broussonetiae]
MVILGAGPAGLVLGNLLHRGGIDCVILERASRAHVQTRARAGFLAANTVRILERHGLAEGLHRRGRAHGTCEFRTEGGGFRLDYSGLGLGEQHTVYPQQYLVTDLLTQFLDVGGRIHFDTEAVSVLGAHCARPSVTVRAPDGRCGPWRARYVAGCDGRHGAARRSLPPGAVRRHHRDHGVSWLGLLVEAPPSLDAVGYAVHDRGFAGHMARTPDVTRYYLQCERDSPADTWPEDRIWDELELRMHAADHGPLHRGRIVQRAVVSLESDVLEPLRHGALFLAGDAASVISPSAAKGANLAVLEAEILARALIDDLGHGDGRGLARYSAQCLAHIWRAQDFSQWMTQLLHGPSGSDGESSFHNSLRRARIESLRTSRSQQDWFAENYVGV